MRAGRSCRNWFAGTVSLDLTGVRSVTFDYIVHSVQQLQSHQAHDETRIINDMFGHIIGLFALQPTQIVGVVGDGNGIDKLGGQKVG